MEALRLEAGRRFGWTVWPSNACEAELQPDGGLALRGHGWGHNVGLCLATALYRAARGDQAEEILQEAFGPVKFQLPDEGADP
jgi:peptidoglycan hydrolase-like amidase